MYHPPILQALLPSLRMQGNESYNISSSDLRKLLSLLLSQITVDEEFYIANNPDVGSAIASGAVANSIDHYRSTGYIEGRYPVKLTVDEKWYRETYVDVDDAIRHGDLTSAEEHYVVTGRKEGRVPRKFPFDAKWYLAAYPEVQRDLDEGRFASAEDHFVRTGYASGKFPYRPTFAIDNGRTDS